MGTELLTYYSEVKASPVKWLWYPYIALGKVTLLQGDPGDGKSTMMMNLMAEYRIGDKTLNEVKIKLGIKLYRKMHSWYWVLPGSK